MNIKEAQQAVLDGKKLTRTNWRSGEYIWFDYSSMRVVNHIGFAVNFGYEDNVYTIFEEKMTFAEAAKIGGVISNGDYELIIDFYAVRRGFKILSIKELIDLIQPDDKIWYTV